MEDYVSCSFRSGLFHFVAFRFYIFYSVLFIALYFISSVFYFLGHVKSRTRRCVATCGTVALVGTDCPFVLVGTAPIYRHAHHALIRSRFGSAQSPSFAPLLGAFDIAMVHLVVTIIAVACIPGSGRDWFLEQAGTTGGIALIRTNLVRPGRGATTPANLCVVP